VKPPVWKAPEQLALGRLSVLELRQEDPRLPPPPRPGEDRLGPLALRGVEPLRDGRGWRLTVQPLTPGTLVVPPTDLGDGLPTPELRLTVPRTVPYGAAWVGVGGGALDQLPPLAFPWPWTLPLLLPLAALAWFLARRFRRGAAARRRHAARRAFIRHWPPGPDRAALDAAHRAGRALLAAHFGPDALGWGPAALQARGLAPWAAWSRALDAARFAAAAEADPPPLATLLAALEDR
jgi:hypothetical protein